MSPSAPRGKVCPNTTGVGPRRVPPRVQRLVARIAHLPSVESVTRSGLRVWSIILTECAARFDSCFLWDVSFRYRLSYVPSRVREAICYCGAVAIGRPCRTGAAHAIHYSDTCISTLLHPITRDSLFSRDTCNLPLLHPTHPTEILPRQPPRKSLNVVRHCR